MAGFPRSGLVALQFLTRLPVQLDPPPQPFELGRSLLWYPPVGLLLGLVLCGAALALRALPANLAAALVLAVWVLATGALHLDGLGDTADAWIGGRGDRERMLAIMKDPYAGPAAVTAITSLLILKFAALSAFCATNVAARDGTHGLLHPMALVLPPLVGRAAVPLLFGTTHYIRAGGIGAQIAAAQSRARNILVGCATLSICILASTRAVVVLVACAIVFVFLRRAFVKVLGGFTGDCAGALIEVTETAALVALSAYF